MGSSAQVEHGRHRCFTDGGRCRGRESPCTDSSRGGDRVVGLCGYFLRIASLFSMNWQARSLPENEREEHVGHLRGRKSQCEIIVKESGDM